MSAGPVYLATVAAVLTGAPAFASTPHDPYEGVQRVAFDEDMLDGFEPPARERRAQDRGKVTVRIHDTAKATMKVVQSETVVQAPAEDVWSVITDYDSYPRFFDRMRSSETTRKQGDWEHHLTVVSYPWPWGNRWVLNVIRHDKPLWLARFKRLEGSVREVEGRWELREKGPGATTLRYGVRMDPGLEFIPSWVVPWATSIVVPDILRSVAKEAEQRYARSQKGGPGAGGPDAPVRIRP